MINELSNIDEEHGTLWVADENDSVLKIKEINKNLFDFSVQGKCQINSNETLKNLVLLFTQFNFNKIKEIFDKSNNI